VIRRTAARAATRQGARPNPADAATDNRRYRDLKTFVVTYQHGPGDARYSAIFGRSRLVSWKLAAVDLNG